MQCESWDYKHCDSLLPYLFATSENKMTTSIDEFSQIGSLIHPAVPRRFLVRADVGLTHIDEPAGLLTCNKGVSW